MTNLTNAPNFRSIDQYRPRPSKFFQALSEADNFCAERTEYDRLAHDNAKLREQADALLCRVDELTDENRELRQQNQDLWAETNKLRTDLARVKDERDSLRMVVAR